MASLEVRLLAKSFETFFLGSAGSGGGSYWFSIANANSSAQCFSCTLDADGNPIHGSENYDSRGEGNGDAGILKLSTDDGSVLLSKLYGGNPGNGGDIPYGLVCDSSNNIYISGRYYRSSPNYDLLMFCMKVNSSGVVQWKKDINGSGFRDIDKGFQCVLDSTESYMYMVGETADPEPVMYLGKVDTSNGNTTSSIRRKIQSSYSWRSRGLAIDSNGDLIVCGSPSGGYGAAIAKFNSNLSDVWSNAFTVSSTYRTGVGVAVDSSDNIFLLHSNYDSYDSLVTKFNSSGAVQWSRKIAGVEQKAPSTNNASDRRSGGIATDSSGNVYVTGGTSASGAWVGKFNTSGTIQWQNFIGVTYNRAPQIAVDASDNVFIFTSHQPASINQAFVAKIPNDGSLTGTYGGISYSTATQTVSSESTSYSGPSVSSASVSMSYNTALFNTNDLPQATTVYEL